MEESRAVQRAGWAGAAAVVLLIVGLTLCATAGVEEPSVSDAAILNRLDDGARQTAAGIGLPVLGAGLALLLWFACGLRRVLDRLSGGDPLAHVIVPAVALLGGPMLDAGVSLRDVQIAARHADPKTTMRYDRARKNLDRHPNYILAAYMASGT
jgi:hypothetical protein